MLYVWMIVAWVDELEKKELMMLESLDFAVVGVALVKWAEIEVDWTYDSRM